MSAGGSAFSIRYRRAWSTGYCVQLPAGDVCQRASTSAGTNSRRFSILSSLVARKFNMLEKAPRRYFSRKRCHPASPSICLFPYGTLRQGLRGLKAS